MLEEESAPQLLPFFPLQMGTLPTNPCMKSGKCRRETVELFILLQTKVKRVFSEYFSWKPRMKSCITFQYVYFEGIKDLTTLNCTSVHNMPT